MKKTLLYLFYFLFFIFSLIILAPKLNIYFFGEKNLEKLNIIVTEEIISDNALNLNINNLKISIKEVDSASIEEANIMLLFFYNSLSVKNIQMSPILKSFMPLTIDNAKVSYTIFNPLFIYGNGNGDFGKVTAKYNILDRNLSILLKPSKKMLSSYKSSLQQFQKNEKGEYEYVKAF